MGYRLLHLFNHAANGKPFQEPNADGKGWHFRPSLLKELSDANDKAPDRVPGLYNGPFGTPLTLADFAGLENLIQVIDAA